MNLRPRLKKSTIQLIVILLLSTLSGLAVFTYTAGVESRVKAGQATQTVFIATKQISIGTPLGTSLNQGYLETKEFPISAIPTNAITSINAGNSKLLALQTIQIGQILLTSNFGISAANTGALVIPDGQLAVTVSLSDPARVANFLQPGSEISIFATGQNGKTKFTNLLISRTLVLAVGNQVLPNSQGSSNSTSSALITVAVSPLQAEKLIHASQTLSLYFGLRTAGVDFGSNLSVTDENLF